MFSFNFVFKVSILLLKSRVRNSVKMKKQFLIFNMKDMITGLKKYSNMCVNKIGVSQN